MDKDFDLNVALGLEDLDESGDNIYCESPLNKSGIQCNSLVKCEVVEPIKSHVLCVCSELPNVEKDELLVSKEECSNCENEDDVDNSMLNDDDDDAVNDCLLNNMYTTDVNDSEHYYQQFEALLTENEPLGDEYMFVDETKAAEICGDDNSLPPDVSYIIKKEQRSDDENDASHEENHTLFGQVKNSDKKGSNSCEELEEKLIVGTPFPDLEKVYLLYCEYARCKGFSVRKGEQRYFGKKSDDIRWKEFNCSCTGLPNYTSVKNRLAIYKKLVRRTGCKTKLLVCREDFGPFSVILFEKDHNHELVHPTQTYLLRSSRNLDYAKKSVLEALSSVGIGVSTACKFMEQESGGVQNVGFIRKDAYDHIESLRKVTQVDDGDARLLVEHFTKKTNIDPYFFWQYQLENL